ncbi:MAG: azurin [Capnocytophaga sp.]|nr:azurin [Capnocytophaga sp.]
MKKVILLALMGAVMAACGDNKKKQEASTPTEQKSAQPEQPAAVTSNANEADIVLESNDQMMFNLKEIKVKEGQKVTLKLVHVGKMSKDVMGHNFVLLKEGTDIPQFALDAMNAKANDYIPANTQEVIAYTKMIGGGESTTIIFDAPAKGEYDFICSFPGHYAMMKGKFIVE